MVQILVHVRPADTPVKKCYEVFECTSRTSIGELKRLVEERGKSTGLYGLPASAQELVFLKERCEDHKSLQDYGINKEFITQVTGFIVNPSKPGKRFEAGVLI